MIASNRTAIGEWAHVEVDSGKGSSRIVQRMHGGEEDEVRSAVVQR